MARLHKSIGILLCFSSCLFALQVNGTTQMVDDWPTVKRGTSIRPVEFRADGTVLFDEGNCRLEITKEDETTTEVQFSPKSPDGEYRVVIGDAYDFQPAYLVDIRRCAAMHLPLPRYVQPWFSWAPDGKRVLFYTNYEASPQLWILDLETGQAFEVHHDAVKLRTDSCCGLNEWAPKSGVAYLVPETVRWHNSLGISFKLEVYCNPYSEDGGWPCENGDIDHPRGVYEVSVALNSGKVASGPMTRLKATPKSAGKASNPRAEPN